MHTAILIGSLTGCIALLAVTAVMLLLNRRQGESGALLVLTETPATSLMSAMLLFVGFFVLYEKFIGQPVAGNDDTSYLYAGGLAMLCVGLGGGTVLYTYLKKVIAYPDKLVFVSFFGRSRELTWQDIKEVKVPPLSMKMVVVGPDFRCRIGGDTKPYKEFVKLAQAKIPRAAAGEVIDQLARRLSI